MAPFITGDRSVFFAFYFKEFDLVQKESQAESFQKRISELERQLAKAQAMILAFKTERNHNVSRQKETSSQVLFSSEDGFRQALHAAPYPLMIWR